MRVKSNVLSRHRFSALLAAAVASMCFANTALATMTESEKSWTQLITSGSGNMDANKYWLAEPELTEALSVIEKTGKRDMRLARSYGELGKYYTIRGRFSEAEPYLEKELAIKEEVLGPLDGKTIPAMGSLVLFYINYGTSRKAIGLTDDLLALIEGKLAEPVDGVQSNTKFKKGMTLEAHAGSASLEARDPLLEWAITCDAIGAAYRSHENYEMAERCFQAALDLKTSILGQGHLSLANSYDDLASVCVARKEYTEAAVYYHDALEITQKIQPSDHPEVYGRLDKLARCLIKAGNYKEAEKLYLRALGFWKDEPAAHGSQARAMYALGSLYVDEKRYAEGASYLRRALNLEEAFDGSYSFQLVPYLQRYAYALYYMGRRAEGAAMTARANFIAPPEKPVVPLVATAALLMTTSDVTKKESNGLAVASSSSKFPMPKSKSKKEAHHAGGKKSGHVTKGKHRR